MTWTNKHQKTGIAMSVWQDFDVVTPNSTTLVSSDSEAWTRVAKAVTARRTQKNDSQIDAGSKAGVGVSFVADLENCKKQAMRRLTAARYEKYLGWRPGSIERLLFDGVEPELDEGGFDPQEIGPDIEAIKERQRELIDRVTALEDQLEKLLALLRAVPKPPKSR